PQRAGARGGGRMKRMVLGRHGQLSSEAGDPLDGLVNLFDLGLVLAIAFLIAGLAIAAHKQKQQPTPKSTAQKTIQTPKQKVKARGKGRPVGQVYRLPD